jgi:large conductance mechanosensitive channel
MLKEFKTFLMRGNVIDLAVAVVIGATFGGVVTALVEDIITPIIAAIGGKPDFANLTFSINHSVFKYGAFINAIISFIIIAAVIFFVVVKPMSAMMARMSRGGASADPTTKMCPQCLSEVPLAATKCKFCTSQLTVTASAPPAR